MIDLAKETIEKSSFSLWLINLGAVNKPPRVFNALQNQQGVVQKISTSHL